MERERVLQNSNPYFMTLLLEFDGDYGSYLRMDYTINCDSAEHKFYQAYALLLCCCAIFPHWGALDVLLLASPIEEPNRSRSEAAEL